MSENKSKSRKTHLLLGGNLGDREAIIKKAGVLINQQIGDIISSSGLYETAAWGKEDQNAFLNQVLLVETLFSPQQLLLKIQQIESELGRIRFEKWGERLIDIDILFMEDIILEEENLKIPHPFIQDRKFTLIPLTEISENYIHPVFQKSLSKLLQECKDYLEVKKYHIQV